MGKDKDIGFTQAFKKSIRKFPDFREWIDIAQRNSIGNVWIIGGFVYRNIIKETYGIDTLKPEEKIDVDFLAEGFMREFYHPKGWKLLFTDYESPYFVKDNYRLDLNSLRNFHSIERRGLNQKRSHFFTGTPLNIQSILYNPDTNEIMGWRGIQAIHSKKIKINNLEEAKYEIKKKGITINRLVMGKAEELGFDYFISKETLE